MHMLVIKNTTNNTIYTMQELHKHYKHSMELHLKELRSKSHYKAFHFQQCFHYILQLIYQLFFFCTFNFYHIHTHNY